MISVVKFKTNKLIDFSYNKNSELSSLFLFIGLAFLLAACESPSERVQHVYSGEVMGTYFRIKMVGDDTQALQALEPQLEAVMSEVNESMSNYIPDSEVSRFNRLKAGQSMSVSSIFAVVIDESLKISKLSKGAFDVTLAPLINAWGFGEQGAIVRQPEPNELAQLAKRIGYQKLEFENNTLTKLVDGLEINVSAIAKGYAVDRLAQTLRNAGADDFLVDIGGELVAAGHNLEGHAWRVGIEKPTISGGVQQVVKLSDKALATSGDYRNFLLVDGQQFSHTIDPLTLKPSFHKLASVSVLSESCSRADALATALMVMGEERGFVFAQENKLAVYMLVRETQSNEYSVRMSEEFSRILQ